MSSDRGRGDTPGIRNEAAIPAKTSAPADVSDPYATWLDRMQRARVRHAAITKNLYTWSNYKNWADRMKGSFEDAPGDAATGRADAGHTDAGRADAGRADAGRVNPHAPKLPKK